MKMLICSALALAIAGPALAETDLTFRYNDPDFETIEAALKDFEAKHPDIKVELQRISWADARTQFLRETAVGEGPDVAHMAFVWPLELGQAGAVLPLNDFITSDQLQGYIAPDLAESSDGEIYALPWTTDTFTIAYNKDLLDEAGIAVPKTWEDLQAASKAFHEKTGKVGFGFPAGSAAQNTIWFLANYYWWSHGQSLIVEDGEGGYKLGLTEDMLAESMEYFNSFMGDGGNPEANITGSNWSDPSIMDAMASGEQAIGFFPPGTLREIVKTYQERSGGSDTPFMTTTDPAGPDGISSHVGGRSLVINANTEHPKEAWELVQYLSSAGFFSDYLTVQLPANKELLGKLKFGPEMQGYTEQLPHARSWGPYANPLTPIGTMQADAGRAFASVFIGEKTPEQAAASYLAGIQKMLDD